MPKNCLFIYYLIFSQYDVCHCSDKIKQRLHFCSNWVEIPFGFCRRLIIVGFSFVFVSLLSYGVPTVDWHIFWLQQTWWESIQTRFFSVIQFSNDVDGVLLIYVAFFTKRILSSKALNFIKKRIKFVNFENVCFCADNAFLSDQWTHVVHGRYLKYNFVAVYVFAWIQFTHK